MKSDPEHTGSIQTSPKKEQALTGPQQEPNQSTKLNKVKGPTTIEDLAQEKRLQTKEFYFRCGYLIFFLDILFFFFNFLNNNYIREKEEERKGIRGKI